MNAIEKLQYDFNIWYETSSLNQFVFWWKTEIKTFVPEKYHEKLFPRSIKVLLTQENKEVTVWCNKGLNYEKYTDASNEEGNEDDNQEQWWHQVQHIINQADGTKVEVRYLLQNAEALVRKIALPSAAKENLDEVIGFELDKYVPFSADQVQISYKIDNENKDENKLLLDLAVVPKQKLTEILSQCDEKSVSLDGIDINTQSSHVTPIILGVNLLPVENRRIKNNFNLKLNAGLALVLMVLIYFVMYTSIENKKQKIQTLTDINSELQKQARVSKLLKKDLKSVIVSSKFLQIKQSEHPKIVAMLSDVTAKLPDSTYLTKMKINQGEFEITGESENANILVPELNKSINWYAPHISGAITPNPVTKKERFTIKADLKEPQEEDDNGQS